MPLTELSIALIALAPHLPYIGAAAIIGALTMSQSIPRIGPLRAIVVALRTRYFQPQPIFSIRKPELNLLRSIIARKDWGQNFII
ncbi:hypothetical protein HDU99_005293, partial [Rhizoclosmatium hyalinum]